MTTATANTLTEGRVVQVLGAIVDIEFPDGPLPEINHALCYRAVMLRMRANFS